MVEEIEALYAISENSADPLHLASPGCFPFFPFRIYEDRGDQFLSDHYKTVPNAYFGYERLVIYPSPLGGMGVKPWFEATDRTWVLKNQNRPLYAEHGPLDIAQCEQAAADYLDYYKEQEAMRKGGGHT
jgi:hypothetical protein